MSINDNSNALMCPMIMMMMYFMTSSHHQHHHHHHYHHASNIDHIPKYPNSSSQTSERTDNQKISTEDQNKNSSESGFGSMEINNNDVNDLGGVNAYSSSSSSSVKSKIMAHPLYHRLLAAFVNCQKVGAPPEVAVRLEAACASAAAAEMGPTGCLGEDPALDQFMEAYCEMLIKYEQEVSKPYKESMLFLQRVECQFKSLSLSSSSLSAADRNNGSSEEEFDMNELVDPPAEDQELKGQLLRKYSGRLGSLKQEFMKKRKKGKLPKEARQQLLDWWNRHYKWPYPSEQQKLALAESTGLDQKQINNWFINQRKRHWKPSEDMQFMVMDAGHPHYYFDDPFNMDISPMMP